MTYFNSIKVQLEQKTTKERRTGTKFQFHKGTIRTESDLVGKEFMKISIP